MFFQLLRFRKYIDAIREKSVESPHVFMWMTLALSALAVPIGYFRSFAHAIPLHLSIPALIAVNWISTLVRILYLGGMLSWGLRRQAQKKSWGVPLPDEAHSWLFRPGVWAGLAIGMLYQFIIIIFGAALWLLLHLQIGLMIIGVAGIVGLVFTVQAVAFFYQIPKRRYLWLFVFSPLLIISVFGIILAIVLGVIHNHDHALKEHVEPSSAVISPSAPPTTASNHTRIAPPMATLPPQHSAMTIPRGLLPMPTRSLTTIDQHCMDGLPLRAPQQSEWEHSGIITRIVPRRAALFSMFRTQKVVHGFLAPEYLPDQRVLVHPNDSQPGVHVLAVVPANMPVHVGQEVEVAGWHVSHHFACRYVPNLLVE